MNIFMDLIAPSPIEIAWNMFSGIIAFLLVGAVAAAAAVLIIRAVKKKK